MLQLSRRLSVPVLLFWFSLLFVLVVHTNASKIAPFAWGNVVEACLRRDGTVVKKFSVVIIFCFVVLFWLFTYVNESC